MKKVSVILADGFEEIEALTVVDLLRRAQIYVGTVSATDEYIVHGAHGINVQTEDLFEEVNFVRTFMRKENMWLRSVRLRPSWQTWEY